MVARWNYEKRKHPPTPPRPRGAQGNPWDNLKIRRCETRNGRSQKYVTVTFGHNRTWIDFPKHRTNSIFMFLEMLM
jgi:hypothetical protein